MLDNNMEKLKYKKKYLGGLRRKKGYLLYLSDKEWNAVLKASDKARITIARYIRSKLFQGQDDNAITQNV